MSLIVQAPEGEHAYLQPGHEIEGLKIRGVLGTGGFGVVYKAWDLQLQREVALKEYFPDALAQRTNTAWVQARNPDRQDVFDAGMRSFVNEARLLAQFDHPALLKVFRFWEGNGTAYMEMPYYKGVTLKAHRKSTRGAMDLLRIRDLIVPLCEALEVLHSQNCIHRDVSPDNVLLLDDKATPILLDFGAARRTVRQTSQSFTVMLKSGYAPIEQYAELSHYQQGPWTDVYGLAALTHFLIRGHAPPPAVGRMIYDDYQPLSEEFQRAGHGDQTGASLSFLAAIDAGLRVEPEARPQSISAFKRSLFETEPPSPARLSDLDLFIGAGEADGAAAAPAASPAAAFKAKAVQAKGPHTRLRRLASALALMVVLMLLGLLWSRALRTEADPAPRAPAQTGWDPHWVLSAEASNPRLRIHHDALEVSIQSPRAGCLSVLNFGADGQVSLLEPKLGAPPVCLASKEAFMFPPSTAPLIASGPPGENTLLIVLSTGPLDWGTLPWVNTQGMAEMNIDSWNRSVREASQDRRLTQPAQPFGMALLRVWEVE